jgi:hypothetical protein
MYRGSYRQKCVQVPDILVASTIIAWYGLAIVDTDSTPVYTFPNFPPFSVTISPLHLIPPFFQAWYHSQREKISHLLASGMCSLGPVLQQNRRPFRIWRKDAIWSAGRRGCSRLLEGCSKSHFANRLFIKFKPIFQKEIVRPPVQPVGRYWTNSIKEQNILKQKSGSFKLKNS